MVRIRRLLEGGRVSTWALLVDKLAKCTGRTGPESGQQSMYILCFDIISSEGGSRSTYNLCFTNQMPEGVSGLLSKLALESGSERTSAKRRERDPSLISTPKSGDSTFHKNWK